MKVSPAALKMVKHHEGVRVKPYRLFFYQKLL